MDHWRNEILDSVRAGKTVIVLLNAVQEVYVATGQQSVSGTGRNQKITRHVGITNNLNLIPGDFSFREANGALMRLDENENVISSYWADLGSECEFHVLIDSDRVKPLLFTQTGKKVVGARVRYKKATGSLYLLPYFDFSNEDFVYEKDDKEYWSDVGLQMGNRFIAGIVGIDKSSRSQGEQTPPPSWLNDDNHFLLPNEKQITEKLLRTETEIEALQTKKHDLLEKLDNETALKDLIFEKGKRLEAAIIMALILMGFDAANFKDDDSEFDVVFEAPEGRLLGEAEGKDNKAVNIDKLRQLAMNIHEDLTREEVQEPAKGVLFGNAFRLSPPSEREEFFQLNVSRLRI